MRIMDGSSDVCSSDLALYPSRLRGRRRHFDRLSGVRRAAALRRSERRALAGAQSRTGREGWLIRPFPACIAAGADSAARRPSPGLPWFRSEEHTSELQSLMRISYAVFCLKKKNTTTVTYHTTLTQALH